MHEYAEENAKAFLEMFDLTLNHGSTVKPRGEEIKELEDFQFSFSPYYPFMTFRDRKYDINYFRKEMRWKLGASKYDDSIKKAAAMWESVQNPDGTFNSNYGQFWFGEQAGFWTVWTELVRDKDSRRAVIPMLSKEHFTPQTKDTVCTEAVGFRIRDGALNMSIHMRSSDQIFGLGTDLPTFSLLYRLLYAVLKVNYPNLKVGLITVTAMSSHIYKRHYSMVRSIIMAGDDHYEAMPMPWCA